MRTCKQQKPTYEKLHSWMQSMHISLLRLLHSCG